MAENAIRYRLRKRIYYLMRDGPQKVEEDDSLMTTGKKRFKRIISRNMLENEKYEHFEGEDSVLVERANGKSPHEKTPHAKDRRSSDFAEVVLPNTRKSDVLMMTSDRLAQYTAELDELFSRAAKSVQVLSVCVNRVYCLQCIVLDNFRWGNIRHTYNLKLLEFMWKCLTYRCVSDLKRFGGDTLSSSANSSTASHMHVLYTTFLRTSIVIFDEIHKTLLKYKLVDTPKTMRPTSKYLFDICVCKGDLYRYLCETCVQGSSNSQNFIGSAETCYEDAVQWAPRHPKPFHQLGILSVATNNLFDSIYGFVKTILLSAGHVDLMTSARERLKLACAVVVSKNEEWGNKCGICTSLPKPSSSAVFISNEVWYVDTGKSIFKKALTQDGTFKTISALNCPDFQNDLQSSLVSTSTSKFMQLAVANKPIAAKLFILQFLTIHSGYLLHAGQDGQEFIEQLWLVNFKAILKMTQFDQLLFSAKRSLQYATLVLFTFHNELIIPSTNIANHTISPRLVSSFRLFSNYLMTLCESLLEISHFTSLEEENIKEKLLLVVAVLLEWLCLLCVDENNNPVCDEIQWINFIYLAKHESDAFQIKTLVQLNLWADRYLSSLDASQCPVQQTQNNCKINALLECYLGGILFTSHCDSLFLDQSLGVTTKALSKASLLEAVRCRTEKFTSSIKLIVSRDSTPPNTPKAAHHSLSLQKSITTKASHFPEQQSSPDDSPDSPIDYFPPTALGARRKDVVFENHPKFLVYDTNCLFDLASDTSLVQLIESKNLCSIIPYVVVKELNGLAKDNPDAKKSLEKLKTLNSTENPNQSKKKPFSVKFAKTNGRLFSKCPAKVTVFCNKEKENYDDLIIKCASNVAKRHSPHQSNHEEGQSNIIVKRYVVLVSNDRILRTKALAMGMACATLDHIIKLYGIS